MAKITFEVVGDTCEAHPGKNCGAYDTDSNWCNEFEEHIPEGKLCVPLRCPACIKKFGR